MAFLSDHDDTPDVVPVEACLRQGLRPERLRTLNNAPVPGKGPVVYWMQASQRARWNPALEYAALCANRLNRPLEVVFAVIPSYPGAVYRHYHFMLEGIAALSGELAKRGIPLRVGFGEPVGTVLELVSGAALVVTDAGYTRFQIGWRTQIAAALSCLLVQVESDVVVPVETASDKEEYAARTLRPRILRRLPDFLVPLKAVSLQKTRQVKRAPGKGLELAALMKRVEADGRVGASRFFVGGEREARLRWQGFLAAGARAYDTGRNDPAAQATSFLSPYLHFGQISALEMAMTARQAWGEGAEPLLEQLIVRRELAMNFVYNNESYDCFACLPDWAARELKRHASDKKEYLYAREELEQARTHDRAWNAAQRQLVATGHMAGYMRMYWGKKTIEWSRTPQEAYETLVYLNDTYELDGRDPNGYAGVAWCFGKHDRPWSPREIFGTVRYMNAAGLARKFDVDAYCALADRQCREAGLP